LSDYRGQEIGDDLAQRFPQPLEDEAEVVTDGALDGIDMAAETAFEEVWVPKRSSRRTYNDR